MQPISKENQIHTPIQALVGHKHKKSPPLSTRVSLDSSPTFSPFSNFFSEDPTCTPHSFALQHRIKRTRSPEDEDERIDLDMFPEIEHPQIATVPQEEPSASPASAAPPSTPPQHVPLPGKSPLITPAQRYVLPRNKDGSWSAKKCFTPTTIETLRQYEKEGRTVIYSIKGEAEGESFRYIGGTQRPRRRTRQHVSDANHPRGTSHFNQVKRALKDNPKAQLSIGFIAVANQAQYEEGLEDRALQKTQRVYTNVINQRRGGGGGVAMLEHPTLPISETTKLFQKLLEQPYVTSPLRKIRKKITHSFTDLELTQEKVIYIFERTIPATGQKKRLVGMTGRPFSKRLHTYLNHINKPEKSPRKKREFYTDAHGFWQQFTISIIPVQSILDRGSTLGQIETVAIKAFDSLRGYNQNKGGGGGAPRRQ